MKNAGYTITRTEYYTQEGKTLFGIALGVNAKGASPYVTWVFTVYNGKYNFYHGNYFSSCKNAIVNYHQRLTEKIAEYGKEDFVKMFVDIMEV